MNYIKFLSTIISLLIRPFSNRVRLGEGGLIIFNIIHAVASQKSWTLISIETIISFLVLCVLYGYNDYTDAEKDKLNPKKDISFINLISENYRLFLILILVVKISTIIIAWLFLGWIIAACIAVLYVINFLYSRKVKSIPLADLIIVSVWGSLYVCISGTFRWEISIAAGLMVGIAHFFQILTDEDSDRKNLVHTTAVVFIGRENLLLFILCLPLVFVLYLITKDILLTGIGFLPFFLFLFTGRVSFSWYASRFVFFILWLVIMNKAYAGL